MKLPPESAEFREQRLRMVAEQIEQRGVRDPHVLAALRAVPRHVFVPEESQLFAYGDYPLSIGSGQTISQPYIVALMTELAQVTPDSRVLEVGAGCGYQAAVLACLADQVIAVERLESLAETARRNLSILDCGNVEVICADGSGGWPPNAPYQAILVSAAAPEVPPPLLAQLAEGGRLVIPVGGRSVQSLQVWHRQGGETTLRDVIPVSFVPLLGQFGWREEESKR